MTILTGGTEIGAGIAADGSTFESTSLPFYDANFCRAAMFISGSGGTTYYESAHVTEAAEVFFHADWFQDNWGVPNPENILTFHDGAGLAVYRLRVTGSSPLTIQPQYLASDNVTWTNIGSTFTTSIDVLNTLDVRLKSDASGVVACYLSGSERTSGTANLSHIGGVSYFRIRSSNVGYWSQMILSDESTIGHRLKTAPATGAGATTDWTGTYTEIDEAVYSDADFVNSATNGQVELFSHSITVPTGYRVKAVIVSARAKAGSSGPQNLQLAIRSGGTVYTSSSQALGLGYGAYTAVWEDDPATSAAFTASAISTLQFGVKAIT